MLIAADAETRAGLATCRAPASSGLRVTAVAGARLAPAHWSRSSHDRHVLPHPFADEEVFVDFNPRVHGSLALATAAGANHSSDSGPAIAHFLLESCDQFGWVACAEPAGSSFRHR